MTDIAKWNAIANEYADWLENCKEQKGFAFNQSLKEAILKRLPDSEKLNILDLGCGDGSLINFLSKRYTTVLGVDGAEKMIEIARKKYPQLTERFLVEDITKPFSFDDDLFDIAICNMVLMDLENIETTIKETFRILRHGGIFILTINHPSFSYSRHHLASPGKRYIDSFHYEKALDTTFNSFCNNYHRPIQYYMQQLLRTNFSIKGFEEISIGSDGNGKFEKYYLTANALLIETQK